MADPDELTLILVGYHFSVSDLFCTLCSMTHSLFLIYTLKCAHHHNARLQTVTAVVAGQKGEDGLKLLTTPSALTLLNHTQEVAAHTPTYIDTYYANTMGGTHKQIYSFFHLLTH